MTERTRVSRPVALLAIILCLSSLLAGCVGRTSSTTAPDGSITLRFLHAHGGGVFTPAIKEFERRHPKIHVEEQPVPFDDLNAQVQARVGSEDPSVDLYAADPPRIPAQAERGFLLDLEGDRPAIENAVTQPSLESVTWNGKLWGYPIWTSSSFLIYNKDLLDDADLPEPGTSVHDRMTWEQVTANARQAQQAGARYGLGFDQVDRYYQLQPMFASAGGGDGLRGARNLIPDITNHGWQKVARWYSAIHRDRLAPRGIPPEQMSESFIAGQVAYYVGGSGNLESFANAKGLNYGIAPHPYFEGGKPATPTDSWSIGVSAYSEHPEVAKKFARFLALNPDGAMMTTSKLTLPPVNKKAYPSFVRRMESDGGPPLQSYGDLLQQELSGTAVHRPRTVGYVEFETTMNETLSDIRNGGDVDELLHNGSERLDHLLTRYRELPS